jgi:prepilin-type N-terminal cleavage/methylation domain-containing protein
MEMTLKRLRGFTLTELIIVVVVLGIMAGFAIPNYTKSIDRSYHKDGTVNLTAIYAAEQIYYNNNNGSYWPASGSGDVSAINSNLGLGILSNNLTYSCSGSGGAFSCTATRTTGPGTMTLSVTQASATPTCSGYCP